MNEMIRTQEDSGRIFIFAEMEYKPVKFVLIPCRIGNINVKVG